MAKPKIPRPTASQAKSPTKPKAEAPKLWSFSFRFWRQIDFFGLDKSEAKWFVSVLEKLSELSKEEIDTFLADGPKKDAWRYHDIDWTKKNIPIQRHDLPWIAEDYRDNEEEYPLLQFQISLALGRVVGFWDENDVFNIVLLDPLHNIQPSKYFDYKVDPCSPLPCVYTTILRDLEDARNHACPTPECPRSDAMDGIPQANHFHDVVILRVEAELLERVKGLIERGAAASLEEVLNYGTTFFPDKE